MGEGKWYFYMIDGIMINVPHSFQFGLPVLHDVAVPHILLDVQIVQRGIAGSFHPVINS